MCVGGVLGSPGGGRRGKGNLRRAPRQREVQRVRRLLPSLGSTATVTSQELPRTLARPRKRSGPADLVWAATRGQAGGVWRRRGGGSAGQRRGGARTPRPGLPWDLAGHCVCFLRLGYLRLAITRSAEPAERTPDAWRDRCSLQPQAPHSEGLGGLHRPGVGFWHTELLSPPRRPSGLALEAASRI